MARTSAPPFASFAPLRLGENRHLNEEANLSQRRKGAKAPDLSGGGRRRLKLRKPNKRLCFIAANTLPGSAFTNGVELPS